MNTDSLSPRFAKAALALFPPPRNILFVWEDSSGADGLDGAVAVANADCSGSCPLACSSEDEADAPAADAAASLVCTVCSLCAAMASCFCLFRSLLFFFSASASRRSSSSFSATSLAFASSASLFLRFFSSFLRLFSACLAASASSPAIRSASTRSASSLSSSSRCFCRTISFCRSSRSASARLSSASRWRASAASFSFDDEKTHCTIESRKTSSLPRWTPTVPSPATMASMSSTSASTRSLGLVMSISFLRNDSYASAGPVRKCACPATMPSSVVTSASSGAGKLWGNVITGSGSIAL
mmetsp:Transcript_3000/g.6776  ORF Transcript_3000/g.6776 Transcript_3000/m.6776 type:complete len:299 (-) Transcript_3000:574-1470(-)